MDNFATTLSEKFAKSTIKSFYESAIADKITNDDYEGEMKDETSELNILTFGALTIQDYNGSDMTAEDAQESVGKLKTNQQKAHYFKIKSLDKFKSWIDNPEGTLLAGAASQLKEMIDKHVLGHYADVAAGNRDGADYTAGTVAIASNGTVTGGSTTFTSAMVGRGFKATGHSVWYRVKTFTNATTIVIEKDVDDATSTYDGGVISSGATYTIEAATAVQITASNIYTRIIALRKKLDKAKVPKTDRWLVMPSDITTLLLENDKVTPAVDAAYDEVIKRGYVGTIAGFHLYESEQVTGDETNGFRVLAGHKSAITFALAFTESGVEDLQGNFGKAYKGLNVFGSKVVDERRKALAEGYWKL